MKTKLLLISALMLFISQTSFAQDTIAAWTFPTGTATDVNPDHHNTANATMAITTQGGTGIIDFSKNGFTTKSAQTTGWDGGTNLKYWQVEVNTTNYNNLKLYSKQTAGGSFPGPRDWKAQYKIGIAGSWADIPGTTLVNANNWTSAVIANVSIPMAANNQSSVFVRWMMISDTSIVPPGLVISTGTTKIDDIYILGSVITSVYETAAKLLSVYPNPNTGSFTIASNQNITSVSVYNILGKEVYFNQNPAMKQMIDLSGIQKGVYFIRYKTDNVDKYSVDKVVVE